MRAVPLLVQNARPYQLEGARFLVEALSKWRGAMLADDMGLGKTLQALLVMLALGALRVLIVGPAIARIAWATEIRKHWPELLPHLRIPAFGDVADHATFGLDQLILVLSYDMFSQPSARRRWVPALRARRWDLMILDEAQYLKSRSNRTRAIYGGVSGQVGLQARADKVLLLSGTPCPNHAGELFPHYTTFWRDLLLYDGKPFDQTRFEETFTTFRDGPYGRSITGSRQQQRLREAFAPVIIRRRRDDVLPELPPLTIQDVPLSPTPFNVPDDVTRGQIDMLMSAPIDTLIDRIAAESVELTTLRRLLGEAKVFPAAEWIRERLDLGVNKMVIFAWHLSVIEGLARLLKDFNPVVITGATALSLRERHVYSFQTEPSVRLFIGQTRAAGSAITLTRATEVAIIEPSWVPGENDQAIARAWRMGQTRPVTAHFCYNPGSLDQRIMRAFRRKAEQLVSLYAQPGSTENSTRP